MLTRDREIGRSLFQAPPEDRALLDLSVRRKVKDEVVAAVLRLQPEDVPLRREAALDRLADQLGIHDPAERARLPEQLAELPGDQWPDENGSLVSSAPAVPPPPPPAAKPDPARRRRRPLAAIVVIVVGALLGGFVGLLLFGGDSDDDGDSGSAPAATAPAPAPKSVDLEPVLPGFSGHGTARIEGSGANSRLVMSLRGLPPREEAYQVWLYNSLTDALPVDRVVGSRLDVDKVLPADPAKYKFIDVSLEPIDDNPNHSGASVLRAPVDELLEKP
jgi:Anti-sigma-K factor rskA